jgi:penicillin-binding protein 2
MKKNRIYEDLSPIPRRSYGFLIFVRVLFVLLLLYFWKIQILDYQKFWNKSEENRIHEIILSPQRGLILDRDGKILAKNNASFKASFIRENTGNLEESYQTVADLLDIELKELKRRMERYRSMPAFHPIVIKDNLTSIEVAKVESRKLECPELIVQSETKRDYPNGTAASHVLGYLQEISPDELKMNEYKSSHLGDMVGKTGIEKQYESLLAGTKGRALEIVDSWGRHMGEMARWEPVKGQDIHLAVDFDLQILAEKLLNHREGAVVMMRPASGEVLAMASYPNFDPNRFINRFTPEEWMELIESRSYPLENRAIRGLYSPGSLLKPVLGLAALDSELIDPNITFHCSGTVVIYGHPFSCWYAPGHGALNLAGAIQNSCNVYFYNLGKKLGIDRIAAYCRDFGLGRHTGIDLPQEKSGLVPDPEWKKRVRNEVWYPGETISVSIGQGPLLVTPLQMAEVTTIISNRGRGVAPKILLPDPVNGPEAIPNFTEKIDISSSHFESVIEGMFRAANRGGTAAAARVDEFKVCGKTGSTQVVSSDIAYKLGDDEKVTRTHSWFTGFAPRNKPEVVVTVIVEYGGSGGGTAAPIAGRLFEYYKEKYD